MGAGFAIFKPAGTVLMVYQRDRTWSVPKGGSDLGEQPLETALRELGEETGIHLPACAAFERVSMNRMPCFGTVVGRTALPDVIPDHRLQVEEVRWAGFVSLTDALSIAPLWQRDGLWRLHRKLL